MLKKSVKETNQEASETQESDNCPEEPALEPGELSEELHKCRSETDTLKNKLQYLAADYENYQKRMEKNEARKNFQIRRNFLLELLPIVDDIERGVIHARVQAEPQQGQDKQGKDQPAPQTPEAREASIIQGLEMIYQNVLGFLNSNDVIRIDCLHSQFDPYLHEAVMVMPSRDHDDGTILEVFQNGYKLNKETLRAAKVKVSTKEE